MEEIAEVLRMYGIGRGEDIDRDKNQRITLKTYGKSIFRKW